MHQYLFPLILWAVFLGCIVSGVVVSICIVMLVRGAKATKAEYFGENVGEDVL